MGVHSLFGFYSFQEQHLKRALVTDTSYVVTHWHRNCSCFLGPLHFLGQLRTAQAYAMVSLSSLFFATVSVTCVNFRLKYCGGGMAFAQCRSSKLMRLLQAGRSSGNDDKINIVLQFFKLNTLQDGWEGLRTRLKYYTTIFDNIQLRVLKAAALCEAKLFSAVSCGPAWLQFCLLRLCHLSPPNQRYCTHSPKT